ncbi:MAG: FGGY family carbohydrate kinase [Chitinophagaceae bacterium]|nr:FGGY family carbohydrate kinase [Chitinophagaceae bacterium]
MSSGRIPVIAIYDIGKTNKKLFLFNEDYEVVYEKSVSLTETTDEDNYPCENLELLTTWIRTSFKEIAELDTFDIVAINFTSYGASFVHINSDGNPLTPLYNYLKPYPEELKKKFYGRYGGEIMFSMHTASPVLGSLNSGMQLYRLKYEQKAVFDQIACSLHLPQYISYLLTGKTCTDITSIGCHTNLWNFPQNNYHEWVYREGIINKLPPIFASDGVTAITQSGKKIKVGVGLHDSSAALIPYLSHFREPFILISTGTWSISFNPFNDTPLTVEELQQDCLCYMTYQRKPVKASRLFAGYEHEQQVKRLSAHFNKPADYYTKVQYNSQIITALEQQPDTPPKAPASVTVFPERNLETFNSYEEAYHQLMSDIMNSQITATGLVLKGSDVKRIFVDGGFGKNPLYMNLLAKAFPGVEVYAASIAQATALGAALAIHTHWNRKPIPADIIKLKYYNFIS